MLCEMQSVSYRIWTRVAVSISYDDNDYTTGTCCLFTLSIESVEVYFQVYLSVFADCSEDCSLKQIFVSGNEQSRFVLFKG